MCNGKKLQIESYVCFLFSDLGINLDFINMAYLSSYNFGVQMWPLMGIKMSGCNLVCPGETWWTSAIVLCHN